MTPLARYESELTRPGVVADPTQRMAVEHLTRVFNELLARQAEETTGVGRLRKRFTSTIAPVQGLYFWGGVGRGKTWLMDLFYECLPFRRKLRLHFHRFMQRVHDDLRALPGEENPLDIVADHIARDARVLCFDEFFVTDITDAMILGNLFRALFARGVTLVTTSNIVPDRLYENGLQRERFLPAIALLNQYCDVINVDGGTDYRLRALERAELYHTPLSAQADTALAAAFVEIAGQPGMGAGEIEVLERFITVRNRSEDVLLCDFAALCDGPRSQNDYIEIARLYHTVLISDVPVMGAKNDDCARRFINLIDEFYDRHVKVVLSAEAPLMALYEGGRLNFEFERTKSRLLEMQSHEYLVLEHRP